MQNKRYIVKDGKPLLVRLLTLWSWVFLMRRLGCILGEPKKIDILVVSQLPSNPLGVITTKLLSAQSKVYLLPPISCRPQQKILLVGRILVSNLYYHTIQLSSEDITMQLSLDMDNLLLLWCSFKFS
jgi:hypothetical protein